MTRLVPSQFRRWLPGVAWICRAAERRHRHWQALRRLGRRPPPYKARWGRRLFAAVVALAAASRVPRIDPIADNPPVAAAVAVMLSILLGAYLGLLFLAVIEYDYASHGARERSCRNESPPR